MRQLKNDQEQEIQKFMEKPEVKQMVQEIRERPESVEAIREALRQRSEDQVVLIVDNVKTMLQSLDVLKQLAGDNGTVETELCVEAGIGNLILETPLLDGQDFSKLEEAVREAQDFTIMPLPTGQIRIVISFFNILEYQKYE